MAGSSSDYPGVAVQRPLLQPTQVPPALSVLRVLCLFSVSKGEHLCWRGRWGGRSGLRLLSKFLTQARERKSRQKQPLGGERGRARC